MASKRKEDTKAPASGSSHKRCERILEAARTCIKKICPDTPPRERILAAACDLFYSEGIHAVGVDTIAAAADTNKMTLYRHFQSKDELIAAYLRKLAEDGLTLWQQVADAHPGDPKGHLLDWIERVGPCSERGCAFINAAAELPDKNHPGRHVIEEYKTRYRGMILQLCRDAKLLDPERLADELHLLFEGAVVSAQSVGAKGPAAHFVTLARMTIDAHTVK